MYRENLKFIDLFCGIGGFRIAFEEACEESDIRSECVFSSDIDNYCQDSYEENFGDRPHGDITKIDENEIPDHDILFGGFPCQPFSIIGQMNGFPDWYKIVVSEAQPKKQAA
jgi:DNA (cytosine-5)-methyltransferase 1